MTAPPPIRPRRRGPAAAVLVIAAASAAGAAAGAVALRSRPSPLPDLGSLPPFSLTAHTGRPLSSEDLRGHVWVADFIFTRCAGICPAMTSRMARLQDEIPAGARLVSFTVDPQHDGPDVLARYARDFHAGQAWLFATGPQQALYCLATQGFRMEALEVAPDQRAAGGDGPFLHSSRFVLVDASGRIRGYYDSADEAAVRRLAQDLRRLAAEGS